MVKVWGDGDVPGAASERTRLEGTKVVGEVGGDHFRYFIWEREGIFVRGTRLGRWVVKKVSNLDSSSMPNSQHVSHEVHPYGARGQGQVREPGDRHTWY